MKSLLMTVEDTFALEQGLALVPGVTADQAVGLVGREVTLVRPDGSSTTAMVAGVEMPSPSPGGRYPITLSLGRTERDIPPRTEVWVSAGGN